MDRKQKSRREVERYRSQADKLEGELKEHIEHVARVKAHLMEARHHWFRGTCTAPSLATALLMCGLTVATHWAVRRDARPGAWKRADLVRAVIHHCVQPRAVMSLPDAIFTARFILLTHELGAHNFSSLSFFDKILEDVSPIVFSCTANEAKCYGTQTLRTTGEGT